MKEDHDEVNILDLIWVDKSQPIEDRRNNEEKLIDAINSGDEKNVEIYLGMVEDTKGINIVKRIMKSLEHRNNMNIIRMLKSFCEKHNHYDTLFFACLEGDEKILIYEFVPNKSLNYFIFGMIPFSIYSKDYFQLLN